MNKSRRQARLTNKTRLAVLTGDVEGAEPVLHEEDHGKSHLNSDGVEKGEDQEHHLQAAISAAAIRAAASSRPSGAGSPGPRASSSSSSTKPAPVVSESLYHIPTPDATGVVSNYSALYIPSRWHDPSSYVRFSDTIEETSAGPTGLGYSYTLDERDDEWLQANNRVARGEGTSASGAAGSTSPSDAGRGLRAKGKDREREKEDLLAPAMSEDDFELVMALMERWTDEKVPTLHTDVSRIPAFADMESLFSHVLPPSFFPNFIIPSSIPPPGILCRMAKAVYPHWRERRLASEGRSIIPQLNYDESNDGDPYVCFRRREAKPVRKTRRTDSQSVDRLASLQQELQKAQQLASDTLARERRKADQVAAEREAWEAKMRLIDVKRKYPAVGLKPDEEELLFRTVIGVGKRQKMEPPVASASSGRDERVVKASRKSAAGRESVSGVGSPAPGLENRERRELAGHPSIEALRDRTLRIAAQIEQDIMTKREGDYQWEDHTDVAYQPSPRPAFQRLYRPLLPEPSSQPPSNRIDRSAQLSRTSAFRLRRGRGGIIRLDRRSESREGAPGRSAPPSVPPWKQLQPERSEALVAGLFSDDWTPLHSRRPERRLSVASIEDAGLMEGVEASKGETASNGFEDIDKEYGRRVSERWRYDSDTGVVGVAMGMRGLEGEDRVIIDDFEDRHLLRRLDYFDDPDINLLAIDSSYLHATERACLEPPENPPLVHLVRPPVAPMAPPMPCGITSNINASRLLGMNGHSGAQQTAVALGSPSLAGSRPMPPGGPGDKKHTLDPQHRRPAPSAGNSPASSSPRLNQVSPPLPPGHPNGSSRPGASQLGQVPPSSRAPSFYPDGTPRSHQSGPRVANPPPNGYSVDPVAAAKEQQQLHALQKNIGARAAGGSGAVVSPNPFNFTPAPPPLNLKLPAGRNGAAGAGGTPQQQAWRAQQQRNGAGSDTSPGALRAPTSNGTGGISPQMRASATSSPIPPQQQPQHVGGSG